MVISADTVKALRERTGVSVIACKKALEDAGGDMKKATALLAEQSALIVEKKQGRTLSAGTVAAYIHNNAQVGAMVLLSCETDFVSKNEAFTSLAYDIAMHAAAMRSQSIEVLMAEPYIKNTAQTVGERIAAEVQKFGERIEVSDFSVFSVR